MRKDTVNRWQYKHGYAYLNTAFGMELACKKFNMTPEQITEKVGVYQRGKRKGQVKGQLQWLKVTKGGWVKTGAYDHEQMRACGFVAKPGTCFAFMIVDPWKFTTIMAAETTYIDHDGHLSPERSLIYHIDAKEFARHKEEQAKNQGAAAVARQFELDRISDRMSAIMGTIKTLKESTDVAAVAWIAPLERELDSLSNQAQLLDNISRKS